MTRDQRQPRRRPLHVGGGSDPGREYSSADPRWSCNRKKAYPDRAIARAAAATVFEKSGIAQRAYGCTHCGAWHIGRAPA